MQRAGPLELRATERDLLTFRAEHRRGRCFRGRLARKCSVLRTRRRRFHVGFPSGPVEEMTILSPRSAFAVAHSPTSRGSRALVLAVALAVTASAPRAEPVPARPGTCVVVFGGDAASAPFEFLDESGVARGFNVDVLRRAARRAGVELRVELGSSREQFAALGDGRIDLMMLARTPDLEGRIEFLSQTWTVRQAIAFRGGRDRYPQTLRQLGDETVAVEDGSSTADFLFRLPAAERPSLLPVRTAKDLVTALERGTASAAVGNALTIEHYAKQSGGVNLVQVAERRLPYGLATRLGHGSRSEIQQLALAIERLRESGELSELVEQHLGAPQEVQGWRSLRPWATALGMFTLVVGAATVTWNRSLRRQVNGKTRALRETLGIAEQHLADLERTTAALQRSDALLRDAERTAGVGSYELDLVGGRVTWTPGLYDLVRQPPDLGPLTGQALSAMLPPDARPGLAALIDEARAGRHGELTHGITRVDGSHAILHAIARPVFDAAGTVVAIRGTVVDVTARRQHEEQLALMRDRALEATAAKSAFLAVMSHELRTPLNGVIGMTTLLLESPLSREQRDQAETIRQCGALLLEQVNEVLDFSRVEAGKLEIEAAPFELRGLLDDTLQIVAERAHARGLELMLDADASLPPAVLGDAGRLRQVILNLLGNAIKFTESGEVVLTARALTRDRIEFSVADTGIGIEPEAIPRLFQPFSQADRSTTRRFGGTGLGLAICRQLVALMDGEIGVTSVPGEGSRFRFTVRLPEADPLDMALPAVPGGYRALVVDDHPRHRGIVAAMLERTGLIARAASSIDEATALVARPPVGEHPYDVIVLDAEIEGATTWAPQRGTTPIAVLALTADAGRSEAPPQWSAILPRPVREPLLAATIARLVGTAPPVVPAAVTASSSPQPAESDRPAVVVPGLHVLVVDDNAINQRVASRSLQKLGCRVDTAANGREAVEAASRTTYALILMDCQMPDMDGYEATRVLRAREADGPRTPIVAMTAGARAEDREACLACGMDDYLSKPFALPDLQRIVAQWAVLPVGR